MDGTVGDVHSRHDMDDEMNDVGLSADDDGDGGKEVVVVRGCNSCESDRRHQTRVGEVVSCWF